MSGWEEPEGFVWLGPGHEVIYASGPQYMAALEASGLGGLTGPCQGFYSIRMDAEMLLGHWGRFGHRANVGGIRRTTQRAGATSGVAGDRIDGGSPPSAGSS